MDIKQWIIKWFNTNSNVDETEILSNLDNNYFELGYLDSIKFVMFLAEIETKFSIQFSNDEFQDRGFSTINGLIEIIKNKISE